VETESFGDTFGPKAQRKKPRIGASTFEELGKLGSIAADEAAEAVTEAGVIGEYFGAFHLISL
jgi:nuclear GTP-binding protein